jgi:hypothetical protein
MSNERRQDLRRVVFLGMRGKELKVAIALDLGSIVYFPRDVGGTEQWIIRRDGRPAGHVDKYTFSHRRGGITVISQSVLDRK